MAQDSEILISNVGFYFRRLRLALRENLEVVATAIGWKKAQLRRFEHGLQNFTIETFLPVADYYHQTYGAVIKEYDRKPTRSELRELDIMQKQVNAYHKSKGRIVPECGVQLNLFDPPVRPVKREVKKKKRKRRRNEKIRELAN